MNPRAIVVAHREPIAAEAIAAALSRFPSVFAIGSASDSNEAVALGERADAVAIDSRLPGAAEAVGRLRRKGIRVVAIADALGDEDGAGVSINATVAALANALAPGAGDTESPPSHPLTPREMDVLTLVSRGFSGKEVARHLNISPKTVEVHKTRIFGKLGVNNQTAATMLAFSQGLVH